MSNQELNNYIYAQSQRGMNADEIRKILVQNGWGAEDINSAFAIVRPKEAPAAAPTTQAPMTTAAQPQPAMTKPAAAAMPVQSPMTAAAAMPAQEPVDMFDMDAGATQQPLSVMPQAEQQPVTQSTHTPGAAVFGAANEPADQQPTALPTQPQVVMKDGMSGKTKMLVFGGIAIVVLGLIAGGAFAYYKFYTSPERVGKIMLQNLEQLKSFNYSLTIQPRLADATPLTTVFGAGTSGVSLRATGVANIASGDTPKGSIAADIVVQKDDSSEKTYSFEARIVDDNGYLQVKNPSALPVPGLEVLNNVWIVSSAKQPDSTKPSALAFTDDEQVQLRTALSESQALTFGKNVGSETIHDVATTRYTVAVSKEGMKALLEKIKPILVAHNMCQVTCKNDFTEIDEQKMADTSVDVWIGKKDYQLYQARIFESFPGEGTLKDIVIELTLWNHNQDVTVDVPSPTKPLQEVLGSIMASILGGFHSAIDTATNTNSNTNTPVNTNATNTNVANTNTTNTNSTLNQNVNTPVDGTKDSDGDGIPDLQEQVFYHTDPFDSDTDNDGYTDGEEVSNGYNPNGTGTLEK